MLRKSEVTDKGHYFKLCGKRIWKNITDDDDFYLKIAKPLDTKPKKKTILSTKNMQKS
jgi:hypothetical protein